MKYLENIILFAIYVKLMLLVAVIIFWAGLFIIFYTYIGYPLLMIFLNKIKKNTWKSMSYVNLIETYPTVTLVVAAYNEENVLNQKIRNSLNLDYPKEKYTVLFVTDGSTDTSNELISRYPAIKLLYEPQRKGKVAAINRAMKYVESEIVIFSDANTLLNERCIINIIRHYNDQKVGGVAGEKKVFTSEGEPGGEGAYWKYESFLKKLDSDFYSVVGAAGELFSLRKSLYTTLKENIILDDFVQSLLLCTKGYIIRYDPEAYALEKASLSLDDEKERKIRISAGGFQAIGELKDLLNIFRYGVLSFQYTSHRVLRWTLAPLSLMLVFLSSLYLYIYIQNWLYGTALALQLVFCLLAAIGSYSRSKLFYLPFYFCFMNFCVVLGFVRYVLGKQQVTWSRAERH